MGAPLLIFLLLLTPVAFAIGVVFGAWMWHRAKAGKSPVPELPARTKPPAVPPAEEYPPTRKARF